MTMMPLRIFPLCALCWLAAPAIAQHFGWAQISVNGPAARVGHSIVYDVANGRSVMFSGAVSTGSGTQVAQDTWGWDSFTWTNLATGGPLGRIQHAMAYDSTRGKVVLFGGSNGADLGDTWEWDGHTWTQVAGVAPTARREHAMAYDSIRGRTVLFGGEFGNSYMTFNGDTWEWNGFAWTPQATTGPSARGRHAMAYDSLRGRTVLFGGYDGGNNFRGDTWEWNGNAWNLVSTNAGAGPGPRATHAMAYDSRRARSVLFGGVAWLDNCVGDTWEWDGSAWTQVSSAGPAARNEHAMTFDTHRGLSVMFGGYSHTSTSIIYHDDTWLWGGALSSAASIYGSSCGNPSLLLNPQPSSRPTINSTAQASLTNIPSSIAFVALGWSRTAAGPFPLPFPLDGYGMPGCNMLQSTEAAAQPVTFTGTSTATYSLPVPNWAGLIGLRLFLQGWAAAPGVNPGNTIVSNGVEWIIGNT